MNQPSEKTIAILDKIIIVSLFVFTAFSMFSISITQISAGVGGLAWLLRTHFTGSWHEQRWPLGIPFALFSLACLVAVADAYDVSYSYKPLKKLLEILIFFWAVNCIREIRLRNSLITLLIISATLAGLLGFYQSWETTVTIGTRVEGTMSVYMTFAGLLMMAGMLTLGRVLFQRPVKSWLWSSLGVIAICLLLTLTRQAWFGFLTGAFFLFSVWRKKVLLIIPVLFIAWAFISSDNVRSQIQKFTPPKNSSFTEQLKFRTLRIIDGKDETLLIRMTLWQGGWKIFKDHPLTGCGFRCVDLIHSQYPDPTGNIKKLRGMHNNFVQLAVDTGILGLTTWLSIWVCFFLLLYKKVISNEEDPPGRWVALGSAAAVIAFLSGGFFESNFYDSEVAALLFFIMSLPFGAPKKSAETLG
jgi:O-antigen ligase